MKYAIMNEDGYWLAGLTKSRGSTAGIGRIWTQELSGAHLWDTREDAEQAYRNEGFDKYDCAFITTVEP